MITIGEYEVPFVLDLIKNGSEKFRVEAKGRVFLVKTKTVRLKTLARSLKCVNCSCVGSVCFLQAHVIGHSKKINCHIRNCLICSSDYNTRTGRGELETPHFNFYHKGKRGGLILMTRDHIIPSSRGGNDSLENSQTMCTNCNKIKGSDIWIK